MRHAQQLPVLAILLQLSTPNPIHDANQMTWMYTNVIEPAKRVMPSAARFCASFARSRA